MSNVNQYVRALQEKARIGFYGYQPTQIVKDVSNYRGTGDSAMAGFPYAAAMTATTPNGGIPAVANQVIFPEVYEELFAPLNATKFYAEEAAATGWERDFELYPRAERTYQVTAYSDHAKTGVVNTNANWVTRQQVKFQTFSRWGDLEAQRYAAGLIPFIAMQQRYAIDAINRYFNIIYMFGAKGIANFGLTNDPDLPDAIAPTPDPAGNTEWSKKDAVGIYNDIVTLFSQLSIQSQGLIDSNSKMKLGIAPSASAQLAKINGLGTATVKALIKEAYPNMEIVVIPEFDQVPTGLVQLKSEIAGREAGVCKYSQKLLSFPVFIEHSETSQKFAGGCFGTVIQYPLAVAQMVGVGNSAELNAPAATTLPPIPTGDGK